jgi:hypothetical protein
MKNKSNTLLLFIASVGLILIAIVFTSVIDKSRNSATRPDTRAKASKSGSMMFFGVMNSFDAGSNSLIVDSLMFEDSNNKSLGQWTVTAPNKFNPTAFPVGTKIKISANPVTFQVSTKTLTANEIEKR